MRHILHRVGTADIGAVLSALTVSIYERICQELWKLTHSASGVIDAAT